MANIKILTPNVYNKIAAGEVIEKPFGAVKELVENSIDAGATRIVIETVNGGLELISVTDNGCGIHEEDVEVAFVKHATSKLNSAEQLSAIDTLGFRGEALSSIAAVSRLTITTRSCKADTGVRLVLQDGAVTDKTYVSANVGTKIEVRDLFYNMPARKKFLKSPSHEGTEITRYIAKLILTNPTLEITYIADGEKVYSTAGNGLEEAIYVIYGADYLSNCIKINFVRDDVHIEGYIGNYEYTKANKNYQTLSVNGRTVADLGIAAAIMQAYKPFLMTRQFPVYVLDLIIPCNKVDVNVHPKKSEVRFDDPRRVNGAFYYCVTDALRKFTEERSARTFEPTDTESEEPPKKFSREEFTDIFNRLEENGRLERMNRDQSAAVRAIENSTVEVERKKALNELGDYLEKEVTVERARAELGFETQSVMQTVSLRDSEIEQTFIPTEEDILFDRVKILGAAFKTYLILELDDKVIFVDQHAAHERILFDKFMETRTHDMQTVLIPYVFSVTDEEARFIEENLDNIYAAGIGVEPFGPNQFRISSVSTLLSNIKMEDFVRFVLSSIEEFKVDDRTLIVENLAKKACKAAVKAGYALNEYEIKYILKQVVDNKILQCPHGRPITVVFTKSQIEKMFKRIV